MNPTPPTIVPFLAEETSTMLARSGESLTTRLVAEFAASVELGLALERHQAAIRAALRGIDPARLEAVAKAAEGFQAAARAGGPLDFTAALRALAPTTSSEVHVAPEA